MFSSVTTSSAMILAYTSATSFWRRRNRPCRRSGPSLRISTGSKIQSVNDAFSRITGYGAGEGRRLPDMQDLIAPEYMDQFRRQFAERTEGMGAVIIQEWEIVVSPGQRVSAGSTIIARRRGTPNGI